MAVYPKGKGCMASVGTGPTRVRKSFKTESEGLIWEQSQQSSHEASKAIPVAPVSLVWTMQQAIDNTFRHVWKGKASEYKGMLNAKQAVAFFGPDTLISEINSTWILEWMEELQEEANNSGSTLNKKLSSLSVMLKRGLDFGGLEAIPRMKRYKESQHRIRWYTDAEEKAMLDTAKHFGLPEMHDFIVICIDTGFRFSEAMRLTTSDYHEGSLLLHAGETKNGNARTVPCSPRVKTIVASRMAQGERRLFPTLSKRQARKQWQDLREHLGKAEDPHWIIHVMRHTCATRLVTAGVPLVTVQAWMGHKVIQTTMRYAHLDKGQLEAAQKLMEQRSIGL